MNYLHWIEDLLALPDSGGASDGGTRGIDVGTGASCIYPLLGAKMNNWQFVATEIDNESFESARSNVLQNQLEQQIGVVKVKTSNLLTEALATKPLDEKFDFVMCNPPFFDDMDEADSNPSSCCTGSANEMVFPGGEIAFIGQMIKESVELRDRVRWFTSLVGRKSSLRKLLAKLREQQISTTLTTEFLQGRTKRWGIAWTFSEVAPLNVSVSTESLADRFSDNANVQAWTRGTNYCLLTRRRRFLASEKKHIGGKK